MKKVLALIAVTIATTVALTQQPQLNTHIYTSPKLPSKEALDKLDLTISWTRRIKVEGLCDGFRTLQLFPGKNFTLLIAQTIVGDVIAMNAETGDTLWRVPVGMPFDVATGVAVNSQGVFVTRKSTLFVLDRDTGKHLLFTINPELNETTFGFMLEAVPSATPTVGEDALFGCFGDYVVASAVPDLRLAVKLERRDEVTAQPYRLWSFGAFTPLGQSPVYRGATTMLIGDNGALILLDTKTGAKLSESQLGGGVVARPAIHGVMAYIPSLDNYLYAVNAETARLVWRFPGQGLMLEGPTATDADVFVKADRGGLNRLDRLSGDLKWTNDEAVKFLSVSRQFVYARDRVDNVLVLDYLRGTTMSGWCARDWILQISNDLTDRLYLASHDGQIICLRHREHVKPLKNKFVEGVHSKEPLDPRKKLEKKEPEPEKKEPEPEKKEPEKKEPEKKDEDKKDADKKDADKKDIDKKDADKKDVEKKDQDRKDSDKKDVDKKDVDKKDADIKEPPKKDPDIKDMDKLDKDQDKKKDKRFYHGAPLRSMNGACAGLKRCFRRFHDGLS